MDRDIRMSRRTAMIGAGIGTGLLAANGTAAISAATKERGASPVGRWAVDRVGLPTYQLAVNVPVSTKTPSGKSYPLEPDPNFLIGNYGLSLFTYASGRYLLVSGERGWAKLNGSVDDARGNTATLTVKRGGVSKAHSLVGVGGVCADAARTQREFGCGTARYTMAPDRDVSIQRTLSVAPSSASDRGQPAVVLSVRITNRGSSSAEIGYEETVLSRPVVTLNRAPVGGERPVTFVNRATSLGEERGILCDATATSDDPGILTGPDEPNRYNLYVPSLAMLACPHAATPVRFGQRSADGGGVELVATSSFTLEPGASREILLVIGLKSHGDEITGLERFAEAVVPTPTGDHFRTEWASALASFNSIPDKTLRSELTWDGHALLAMATYSAYYRLTFIPQGMTYDYHIDLTAAPRDHLQHSMAAAYFAKDLAKSSILYTLCKMTYQGEIKYTDFGNGETSNSAWNTSDQQLYLFQAVGEYLRITKDWSILDDQTPYQPKEAKFNGSTLEKLARAFTYLRDEVGTGGHGLIRLMNSDWSDMVYVDNSVLRYFNSGESQMNTAMAMAVIPNLIEQLSAYGKARGGETAAKVQRLTKGLDLYLDRVSKAMMRDMEGRTFARRVYLDADKILGDDNMHLEPQSFLLQAAGFPTDRKRVLWKELQQRLIAGEVLGPRQREKPVVGGGMEPGVSENGGFWYALAGQTVIGVATIDRTAALALLDRMTFRNFSAHYPDYWVGQWTAPDTINAVYCGDIQGLPRPDNDGMWCKFAVYCAHAHAWPIYAYYRIRDLT